MSFSSKVVIVTGASSGIGAATAILFAQEGANVVLVGRNEKKLKNVTTLCEKSGNKPFVMKADVSNDEDAKRIIKETVNTYGKIDVLVNNAGIVRLASILSGNLIESYEEIMATNLRAVFHLTSLAVPYLIETKGNIVNISSLAGQVTSKILQFLPYSVSKAGLDHFTRGAALELAPSGVRVNAISPGPVKTDIGENSGFEVTDFKKIPDLKTPLGRIGEAEEIGDLVLFLASDKAKSITGSIYVSDNGLLLKH